MLVQALSKKPANLTHQEAASLPVAALTTVQAFRNASIAPNSGNLELQLVYFNISFETGIKGAKVLVHAGSGGVGSFGKYNHIDLFPSDV